MFSSVTQPPITGKYSIVFRWKIGEKGRYDLVLKIAELQTHLELLSQATFELFPLLKLRRGKFGVLEIRRDVF